MKLFLEIVEEESYEPFVTPSLRIEVDSIETARKLAEQFKQYFRKPKCYLHICKHDTGESCVVREL